MNFNQKKDGSCTLNFSEEEIKIIKNKKSIHFTAEALRHFGNILMAMVIKFNDNFDEKTKNMMSYENQEIETTEENFDDNKN